VLSALGVKRGDTIALIVRNRPEFHPIDLGATGPPKGVQLTHSNHVWMARTLPVWWRMTAAEQSLVSYIPMAHVAERILSHYIPTLWGWPVTCCDDPRSVGAVLPAAEPSVFFAPPRLWKKLRATALAGPLGDPGSELRQAFERGLELVHAQQAGHPVADERQQPRPAKHEL
jgi:long-chain acyl-CoA synthetase